MSFLCCHMAGTQWVKAIWSDPSTYWLWCTLKSEQWEEILLSVSFMYVFLYCLNVVFMSYVKHFKSFCCWKVQHKYSLCLGSCMFLWSAFLCFCEEKVNVMFKKKKQADYLFSMMLGLAVTRWVLVPTSSTYCFESGGRLHLKWMKHTTCLMSTYTQWTCTQCTENSANCDS